MVLQNSERNFLQTKHKTVLIIEYIKISEKHKKLAIIINKIFNAFRKLKKNAI